MRDRSRHCRCPINLPEDIGASLYQTEITQLYRSKEGAQEIGRQDGVAAHSDVSKTLPIEYGLAQTFPRLRLLSCLQQYTVVCNINRLSPSAADCCTYSQTSLWNRKSLKILPKPRRHRYVFFQNPIPYIQHIVVDYNHSLIIARTASYLSIKGVSFYREYKKHVPARISD